MEKVPKQENVVKMHNVHHMIKFSMSGLDNSTDKEGGCPSVVVYSWELFVTLS